MLGASAVREEEGWQNCPACTGCLPFSWCRGGHRPQKNQQTCFFLGRAAWTAAVLPPKGLRLPPKGNAPNGRQSSGSVCWQSTEPACTLTLAEPTSCRMRSRCEFSGFRLSPSWELSTVPKEEALFHFPDGWWPGDSLSIHPLHPPLPKAVLTGVSFWRWES